MDHLIGQLFIVPSKGTAIRYLCIGVENNRLVLVPVEIAGNVNIDCNEPKTFIPEHCYVATPEAGRLELPIIRAEYNQALQELQERVEIINRLVPAPDVEAPPVEGE